VAYHAAFGGLAVAHDYALGGAAFAAHANDQAARDVLFAQPITSVMRWLSGNAF
jgi:hypothetical protein